MVTLDCHRLPACDQLVLHDEASAPARRGDDEDLPLSMVSGRRAVRLVQEAPRLCCGLGRTDEVGLSDLVDAHVVVLSEAFGDQGTVCSVPHIHSP